jgi:hypothetical protein
MTDTTAPGAGPAKRAQHAAASLSPWLSEPRPVRGPPHPADGQNSRLILSGPRGALQSRVPFQRRLTTVSCLMARGMWKDRLHTTLSIFSKTLGFMALVVICQKGV